MVWVQGHMLANALLCPDLNPDQLFNDVTFYLDTPLIVRLLALEGTRERKAALALIRLLADLGGNIAGDDRLVEAISGVRRLEACRRAGVAWRAEVRDASFSDAERAALMHGENEWTEGISPLENAVQWKAMLDAAVFRNQSALAHALGCHRGTVSRAARTVTNLFGEPWIERLVRPAMHEFSVRSAERLAQAMADPDARARQGARPGHRPRHAARRAAPRCAVRQARDSAGNRLPAPRRQRGTRSRHRQDRARQGRRLVGRRAPAPADARRHGRTRRTGRSPVRRANRARGGSSPRSPHRRHGHRGGSQERRPVPARTWPRRCAPSAAAGNRPLWRHRGPRRRPGGLGDPSEPPRAAGRARPGLFVFRVARVRHAPHARAVRSGRAGAPGDDSRPNGPTIFQASVSLGPASPRALRGAERGGWRPFK